MIDDIIAAADGEIERTAQEAAKAALVETGSGLAAEQKKREKYEQLAEDLALENRNLREENGKLGKQARFWKTAGIFCAAVCAGLGSGITAWHLGAD
jgi:hypothetical protein